MTPTREQILNEPAGRTMDEWVAEFVMGLIPGEDWHEPCFDPIFCDYLPPAYSEDRESAWKVLEEMRQEPVKFATTLALVFNATLDEPITGTLSFLICLSPLIICRAALLAKLGIDT